MRSPVLMAVVAALLLSACGGRLVKKQYEYEEELYLGVLEGAVDEPGRELLARSIEHAVAEPL